MPTPFPRPAQGPDDLAAQARWVPHMVWMTGPRGEVEYHNHRTLAYLGWTEQGMARPGAWWDAVHPDDHDAVKDEWQRAVAGGEPYRAELRVRRADGAYRWHLALGEPVPGADGAVERWVGTLTDIHERKLVELELDRAREELAARVRELERMGELSALVARARDADEIHEIALDSVGEILGADRASLLMFDDDGVLRFRAWRGLSEAYRTAVEGHTPWQPGQRDAQAVVIEDVEAALELEGLREVILGEGIRSMAFLPLQSDQGVVGKFMVYFPRPRSIPADELRIARAVADHVAITLVRERERRELRAALEAADRANRARVEFVGSVSHEMRTPLNAVVGYTDLLLEGIPEALGPRTTEQVTRIRESARQLQQIIDEILHFTRLETGHERAEPAPTSIRELLTEIHAVIDPLAREAGLKLRVRSEEGPETVSTDARKVRQVLINLLGNAVKFTERGWIDLEVRREGGNVRFDVRDTGVGLTDEEIPQIFEPFWQGSRARPGRPTGTGLGLAISQRMTHLMGGSISVESRSGGGSVFTVRIPDRTG